MDKIDPLDIYIKLRKTWKINPKTRVVKNKRKSRKKEKQELKRRIESNDF